MPDAPVIVFVRMPSVSFGPREPEWHSWYDTVHIPARLRIPGIQGAYRFKRRSGDFDYITFYEASDHAAFGSDEYSRLREYEASLPADSWERTTGALPGFARGAYKQCGGADAFPGLAAVDLLSVVGYDVPEHSREEFSARYESRQQAERVPGVRAEWRFKLASPEEVPMSGTPAPSPEFVSLYHLDDSDPALAEKALRDRDFRLGDFERFRLVVAKVPAPG